MGQAQETRGVVGIDYEAASDFVWRFEFMYRHLRDQWPGLPKSEARGGNFLAMQFEEFMLPNGSICRGVNQEKESLQGKGLSAIRMEEPSLYKRPSGLFGQTQIITSGRADVQSGHVVMVTNASPNHDWQELKQWEEIIWNLDPSWNP